MTAFRGCSNLTNVKFCDEFEEFVSCEGIRVWWNRGVHERSLSTYRFLVRCSIPQRLGIVPVRSWQTNIYNMLGHIPTTDGLVDYFISIDSKLSVYEILTEAPALVELVIPNNDIVLHVLSYL